MHLFDEFKPVSDQQWKDQLLKDLKGTGFDDLKWKNNSGIEIEPFYTASSVKETASPVFLHNNWDICESIIVTNEREANQRAINALEGGASGLAFTALNKIDTATLLRNISVEHIY